MKKNTYAKLFGLALTATLTVTALTACGGAPQTEALPDNTASAPLVQEDPAGSVGTVLLSVNPEIEMDYDEAGNVVALTGLNDDGRAVLSGYTGYEGKACTTVIGELVDEINAGGYFDTTIDGNEKNIVLKLERGSRYPSDQFLNELAEAVRLVVEADQIGSQTVTLDDDDYDDAYADQGYINAQAAQNILSTQLGRDDIQFVEKDYDLDDGEYEVEFVMDGVEYEYEVNAVTGKVTEMDMDYRDYDDSRDFQKVRRIGEFESVVAHYLCQTQCSGDLREFGRLYGYASEQAQPGSGSIDFIAEQEDGGQQSGGEDVQRPGYGFVESCVQYEQDEDSCHEGDPHPYQLVAASGCKREYTCRTFAVRGGVDIDPTEHGQYDIAGYQDPVQFSVYACIRAHCQSFSGGT